ncbi:MAG: Do family serine endopeptidase [Rhodospirillales bacterium]|nr:Do family serine endopeptidase [Rhodospirillales bacterium]
MRIFSLLIILIIVTFPAMAQERTVPDDKAQVELSFSPLVKQVAPAVVNIYTKRVVTQRVSPFFNDPFLEHFFGGSLGGGIPRQRVENSLGSGVIIAPDGLVVTNAHVAKDADEITVVLPDGREFEAQKVIVDEPSDLALLRIDPAGTELPHASLKPSESLEVGDLVLAIGNPFGVGQTVTSGIVSALARSSLDINDFNFFIQTDAAINPGNSGGALVAMDGGVVGINSAIFSKTGGSLGIGFAIPSEMVATVIAAEKAGQSGDKGVTRPWLGITAQKVTADIADSLDFDVPHGVLVAALHADSPLRKAEVKVGDVVLAVNGKDVRDPAEMKFRMAMVPLGSDAQVEILRKGKRTMHKVKAMAPPDDPPRDETMLEGTHPLNGATVANINPAVAVELGIGNEEGVVVMDVDRRRPAIRVTVPGDLIRAVNGAEIKTVSDLKKALAKPVKGAWQLILERGGQTRQIVIR